MKALRLEPAARSGIARSQWADSDLFQGVATYYVVRRPREMLTGQQWADGSLHLIA